MIEMPQVEHKPIFLIKLFCWVYDVRRDDWGSFLSFTDDIFLFSVVFCFFSFFSSSDFSFYDPFIKCVLRLSSLFCCFGCFLLTHEKGKI